jgi:hypothetical protein
VTCSRDTSFCKDLNRVMCGGTCERKRDREREGGAKQRLRCCYRCVGRERPKGRENNEISNPRSGHNRASLLRLASRCACICLQLSSFMRGLCARLITSVLRTRRKTFEICICSWLSRRCKSTMLPYTACSSPHLKTLPHAFNTSMNIRNNTRNCKSACFRPLPKYRARKQDGSHLA